MYKKLLMLSLVINHMAMAEAVGPTIECRFAAMTDNAIVELDEVVGYTLIPATGVTGLFAPYSINISVDRDFLNIGIKVDREPVTATQIPVINVIALPVGGSVFGVNTFFHEPADGFVSLRYECIKVG